MPPKDQRSNPTDGGYLIINSKKYKLMKSLIFILTFILFAKFKSFSQIIDP